MMHSDFEYVLISMKSPKEVKALLQLKNMFKASTNQIVINKSTMCKNFEMTRVTFSNFITRLISYNFFNIYYYFMLILKMANYKRLFLAGHSYYLTIVTYERNHILIENIEFLREAFRESKRYYKYDIDAIVILPNHIHMIITPENYLEYPKIIHAIKYNFSKRYTVQDEFFQSASRNRRKIRAVWQKRYYEHTIRDEKDYWRCLEYIKSNPVKHGYVDDEREWAYLSC